ncbi:MAG: MFS transporter [Bulleidia sp.]
MKFLTAYRQLPVNNHILAIGRMMTTLGSCVFSMLTLILSLKMGLSASAIAVVMFAYGVLSVPTSLIGGKLADRFSKKKIIICCDLCSIIACFYTASVPLSWTSLIVFALGTLMQGMEYPAYTALIAELTPSEQREAAYSLNYLGSNLGMILSPTLGGLLFQNHLNLMFVLQGSCIALSTFLICRFLDETKTFTDGSVYETSDDSLPLRAVFRNNHVIVMFIILMALYFSVYNQYTYLLPLDMGMIHGDAGAVIYGTVSSINCVTVVICTPLITKWFDRLKEPSKITAGCMLVTAGFVLYIFLRGWIPGYYPVMIIFTWGEIFTTITMDTFITRRIPSSHTGRVISVANIVQSIGIGLYQMLTGKLYDILGAPVTWTVVIATGAACVAVSLYLKYRDRREYPLLYQREENT